MLIASVLASVVFLSYSSNDVKARYQAERLRSDLRHAQMLAITLNRPLLFTATTGAGGSYAVSQLNNTTCVAGALTDPATNDPFSAALDAAVTLGGAATLYFDHVGRPASACNEDVASALCKCTLSGNPAANYTVSSGSKTYTVEIKGVTGFVTVTP